MALDPTYFFYSEGTITVTNGSDIATGNFTAWDPAVLPFDFVFPNDGLAGMSVIEEVLAMDQIRLAKPWTGPTLTDVPYFMVRWTRHTDPRIYAVRVSDYLARLKAIPENIEEVAGEINADRQAVDAALALLSQIEANVDANRQAAQAAAGAAQGAAAAASQSAATAQQWAEAASSGVLPDNGVTNTKLADMPANTLKGRRNSAGDPEDLSADQVRTLLGTQTRVIATVDVGAPVAAVDFTLPVGYRAFKLLFDGVQGVTDAQSLLLRVSTDGGATFNSGASYQVLVGIRAGTSYTVANALQSYANLTRGISKPTTTLGATGEALILPGSAAKNARIQGRSAYFVSGQESYDFDAYVLGSVNAIRLFMASGNIERGAFTLQGVL